MLIIQKMQPLVLGEVEIRVNCICPGGILDKKIYFSKNSKFSKSYLKKVPLKRFGNAQEIAEATYFYHPQKLLILVAVHL